MKTIRTPYWEEWNALIGDDRRKERRIPIAFPVEVSGFDRRGQFFSERTATQDVSEWGCRLQLAAEVEPGTVVALRIPPRAGDDVVRRALLFQIVWVEWEDGRYLVGAAKLGSEDLWHMGFPKRAEKLDDKEDSADR